MELVVAHLLVVLAADRGTAGDGMLRVVVVEVGQCSRSGIDRIVCHRLDVAVRTLVISIDIALAMELRIDEEVECIVVVVEVAAGIGQLAPRLDGTVVHARLEVLSAIEALGLDVVRLRQVRQYVVECPVEVDLVGIDLAVVIVHVLLSQGVKLSISSRHQFAEEHVGLVAQLDGVDADHGRVEVRLVGQRVVVTLRDSITRLGIAEVGQCHIGRFDGSLTLRLLSHLTDGRGIVVVDLLGDDFADAIFALSVESGSPCQRVGRTFAVLLLSGSIQVLVNFLADLLAVIAVDGAVPVVPILRTVHVECQCIARVVADVVRRMEQLGEVGDLVLVIVEDRGMTLQELLVSRIVHYAIMD